MSCDVNTPYQNANYNVYKVTICIQHIDIEHTYVPTDI